MIRSPDDLYSLLVANLTRKKYRAAFDTNGMEIIGGFHNLPPSSRPGWVVKVGDHYLAIILGPQPRDIPRLHTIKGEDIPWDQWVGPEKGVFMSGVSPSFREGVVTTDLPVFRPSLDLLAEMLEGGGGDILWEYLGAFKPIPRPILLNLRDRIQSFDDRTGQHQAPPQDAATHLHWNDLPESWLTDH